MRKLLLSLAATAALASPALSEVMVKAPASDVVHAGAGSRITVPVGVVIFISNGNKVGVFDPVGNAFIPALTVTTALSTIVAMAFTAPNLLTVQGGSFGQVISYATSPPTLKAFFPLP
jgi:hypothetical protein